MPAPPAALREEVTATLDAAIADPEVAANLGTLVRAAHWAGFGLAPLPEGAPTPKTPKTPKTPTTQKTPPLAPAEAAAERERRRQEKIDMAERALAQADQDARRRRPWRNKPWRTRSADWNPSSPTRVSGWPRRGGSLTGPPPGSGERTRN